jgi:hypothetical protein
MGAMTFLLIGAAAGLVAVSIAVFVASKVRRRAPGYADEDVTSTLDAFGVPGEHIPADETDDERRLRKLREFQRAEKVREAAEELELHGPEPEIEQPIGTLITHEVMEMRREEDQFRDRAQEGFDHAEVSRVVAEARDLVRDMNAQFGWQLGEPSIPDRMFNTDIETVLGTAISKGKVDFRTHRMVATMRTFARAQTGGRNELAKVMATRVLLGTGRLTEEELKKLNGARRLFGDDFAEAAGFVDHMTREQERIQAKKLGLAASRERSQDRNDDFGIERDHHS